MGGRGINARIQVMRVLLYCASKYNRICMSKNLLIRCYGELRHKLGDGVFPLKMVETFVRELRRLAEEGRIVERPTYGIYCVDRWELYRKLKSLGLILPELQLLREEREGMRRG